MLRIGIVAPRQSQLKAEQVKRQDIQQGGGILVFGSLSGGQKLCLFITLAMQKGIIKLNE